MRWGSTHAMIDSIIENLKSLEIYATLKNKIGTQKKTKKTNGTKDKKKVFKMDLSPGDIEILKSLRKILSVFNEQVNMVGNMKMKK